MVARGGDATTLRQRSKLTRSTPHFYKRTCLLREFQSITSLGRMRAERGEIESSVVVVASADDAAGSMMTVRVLVKPVWLAGSWRPNSTSRILEGLNPRRGSVESQGGICCRCYGALVDLTTMSRAMIKRSNGTNHHIIGSYGARSSAMRLFTPMECWPFT